MAYFFYLKSYEMQDKCAHIHHCCGMSSFEPQAVSCTAAVLTLKYAFIAVMDVVE